MGKINAIITGIGGYVPEYVLTNEELSRMVDTSDEWITTRVGIKERRILTEEGLGTSYMARKAAKQLIQKTGVDPDTIDENCPLKNVDLLKGVESLADSLGVQMEGFVRE